MLGTIEELEKDIEQFQSNVAASGELVVLLKQMVEHVKKQNEVFETKSQTLISRVEGLPVTIENANNNSNIRVKNDVTYEIDRMIQSFSAEQNRYLENLESTRTQIQKYISQVDKQEETIKEKFESVVKKFDEVLSEFVTANKKNTAELLESFSKIVKDRNEEFASSQQSYISAAEKTQANIADGEKKLAEKYTEFIDTLNKTNISNIYDQNVELKKELNKRTVILMVISGISILVGVLGLFL